MSPDETKAIFRLLGKHMIVTRQRDVKRLRERPTETENRIERVKQADEGKDG